MRKTSAACGLLPALLTKGILAAAILLAKPASAQVTNDWFESNSGNFSDVASWATNTGPVPANGVFNTNVLRFSGTGIFAVTNDFATTPFQLHGLIFSLGDAAAQMDLDGGQMEFLGNGVDLPSIVSLTNVNGATVRIANDILMNEGLVLNGSGGNGPISLNGILSGTGALIKTGGSTNFILNNQANSYSGGTFIQQGRLQANVTVDNSSVLGTGPVTLMGGTLDLGLTNNSGLTIGAGAGSALVVTGANSTITINRISGSSQNGLAQFGSLTNHGVQLTVTPVNNYALVIDGTTTIDGNATFNVGGGGPAQGFGLQFNGPIEELSAGSTLIKTGTGRLGYTNHASPTFSGGTVINQGNLVWRTVNQAAGTYSFGSGPITLDGSGAFSFQHDVTRNYSLSNDVIVLNQIARGGVTNYGGGNLDFLRNAGSPVVTNLGAISLGGTLTISSTNAGSATPAILAGPITLKDDNRTLIANLSGTGNDNRFIISGNIGSDNGQRQLVLVANNGAGLLLSGTNSGLGSILVKPSFQGGTGRVLFRSPDALPTGKVTVEDNAYVGLQLTNFAATSLADLATKFEFLPGAILGLDGYGGPTGTGLGNTNSIILDLSATGLNADIRLGASVGFTTRADGAITPFGDVYKLGGGGGSLQILGTDRLTDGVNPRSLSAGPNPYNDPIGAIAGGTLVLNASNSYSGGTIVNPGATLQATSSNTFGSGDIVVYGTLTITGTSGSLLENSGTTNRNNITLQPGAVLTLGDTGSSNADRFADTATLSLNAGRLNYQGRNQSGNVATETIGDTTFGRGAIISMQSGTNTNAVATLTLASLSRGAGLPATLELLHNNSVSIDGNLGAANKLIVSGGITTANGMAPGYIVNNTDRMHVDYVPGIGFTNATYTSTDFNTAGATDLVNNTAATTVTTDVSVQAFRSTANINVDDPARTITIDSANYGSAIFTGNQTNSAILNFGVGEGLIYNENTTTISNQIIAGSITKFGAGTLAIPIDLNYTNGWDINRGSVTINSPAGAVATGGVNHGLGVADANNYVNLNGGATLNFNGVGTNITYASGKITSLETNAITASMGNQDNRTQIIAPLGLEMTSFSNGPLGSVLRIDVARSRSTLQIGGPVILSADSIFNIRNTGGASLNSGGSNRVEFAGGLWATNRSLIKQGNGVLELSTDNSGTFVGSTITVVGGVVSVGHNGSLGDATSTVTVLSNAVLSLGDTVENFQPIATVNQLSGSAERWQGQFSRFNNDSSTESYSLPTGVDLQIANIATNANTAFKTVVVNGGTVSGFQYTDDSRPTTITNNYRFVLATNSSFGQSLVDIGRSGVVTRFDGTITETGGSWTFTKVGLDIVQLNNAGNAWSGGTFIKEGQLRNGAANVLPNSTILGVTNQAVYNLNNFNQTIGGLHGNGMVTNSGTGNPETLTVNGSSNTRFDGVIGGVMRLVKNGTGELELTGANTYSGGVNGGAFGTIITNGTLRVNNTSGSATGTNAVILRANGTLAGAGIIGGTVTNIGGTVAPGNSAGTLTIEGNFIVASTSSIFAVELAGPGGLFNAGVAYDQLAVGGDVVITDSALSILTTPFVSGWQIGDEYTIIDNQGANPISGFFTDGVGGASLFQGSSIFVDGGGVELTLDYLGGTGNDLVLTVVAVPEPQTVGLLVIGGALCAFHVMRRRRRN